jgi:small subunit ribosomal protein S20
MANSAQARKRARQALVRRARNNSTESTYRSALKKVRKAIASGDKAAANAAMRESTSVMDGIARTNAVHKNTAARHKSRLARAIKALA